MNSSDQEMKMNAVVRLRRLKEMEHRISHRDYDDFADEMIAQLARTATDEDWDRAVSAATREVF